MIIARIAYDAPGKDEQRMALFEAHRAHLRSRMARIVQSGPLFDTDAKGAKRGALVVFEAANLPEVERFNAADPYVVNGVYDRIELLRWDKTIG